MTIQDLDATKTHRPYRPRENILFPSIKALEPLFSILKDLKGSSSSVTIIIIQENINPGPGAYETPSAILGNQHYISSKHEGTGLRTFSTGRKISKFDEFSKTFVAYPGPGSYRSPS